MIKLNMSVVIPVYNDAEGIISTLRSLVKQDYPAERYEVIVVDNKSTDCTSHKVEAFQKEYPLVIKLIYENNIQSSYAARNRGIENSTGDIICFIDSDMWVEKDWLSRIEKFFRVNECVDYLGYKVKMVSPKDSLVYRFDTVTAFPIKQLMLEKHFSPTGALAVRRKIFEYTGMFDERFFSSGDVEFGNRVYGKGCKIGYSDDIAAYHPASNLRQNVKRYFNYGRGHYHLVFHCPERYTGKVYRLSNPKLYLPPNFIKFRRVKFGFLPSSKERMLFSLLESGRILLMRYGYLYERYFKRKRAYFAATALKRSSDS